MEYGLHGSDLILYSRKLSSLTLTEIFELVVGYPPFDNLQPNKDRLIQQMAESIGTLPEKWKVAWKKSYDHGKLSLKV